MRTRETLLAEADRLEAVEEENRSGAEGSVVARTGDGGLYVTKTGSGFTATVHRPFGMRARHSLRTVGEVLAFLAAWDLCCKYLGEEGRRDERAELAGGHGSL